MFPFNGGGAGRPAPMMPQAPAPAVGPAQAPQGASPQMGAAPQSQAAQLLAAALQAIMREGMTPPVQTALEGFFLMLQKLHQSASPAPQGAPMGQEQMGFSALPNAAAHNAPVPGGRY